MLAELMGKISSRGTNLNDRLEDQLTGDFFGALRYIPFNKVLGKILERTSILQRGKVDLHSTLESLDVEYWAENITFWPYNKQGELDALLEFEEILIGIEVKLFSGLSSEDDVTQTNENEDFLSINQLARESRILKEKTMGDNKPALLIFIAPEDKCKPICQDVLKRNIIIDGIELGYLSWEEILVGLGQLIVENQLNHFEKLIIKDLIELLKRKGFQRFRNFYFQCTDINEELWFKFDGNSNTDVNISFTSDQVINGEDYYEFR